MIFKHTIIVVDTENTDSSSLLSLPTVGSLILLFPYLLFFPDLSKQLLSLQKKLLLKHFTMTKVTDKFDIKYLVKANSLASNFTGV